MRFADDWLSVVGTALALLGGKSASVSQSSAPELSADDTGSLLSMYALGLYDFAHSHQIKCGHIVREGDPTSRISHDDHQ
jgi:hypothetical protein